MPSLASVVAIGLSLLIAVPVLALTSGSGCLADAGPASTGATTPGMPSAAPPDARLPQGADAKWDAQQVVVAATIVEVGRARNVPLWGQVIAVATAMQESRLRNLPGGDRDSIGVFQQRPSQGWGNPIQLRSVDYQAGRFYDALLAIPGWQTLPLTKAAQAVQRSAHPDAYTAWTADAAALIAQISGQEPSENQDPALGLSGMAGCSGSAGDGLPAGGPTELPAGFSLPPGTPARVVTAITWALAQRGTPYSYGGDCTAPRSGDRSRACDCSSLVQMAYRTAGIPLPRTTGEQVRAGTPVQALGQLRPGDLVFIPGADGTPAAPGHVALYVGGNLAVHAPRTGDVVRLVDITTWRSQIVGIRRVLS